MTGQHFLTILGALALGTGIARGQTEVIEVTEQAAPGVEEVRTVQTVESDRVRTILALPGERRVVRVRSFRVARTPQVVQVTRPDVVVQEVRAFAEPVMSFRDAVEEALIEHDLRHVRSFAPVVVDDHHRHHDDDDDDD